MLTGDLTVHEALLAVVKLDRAGFALNLYTRRQRDPRSGRTYKVGTVCVDLEYGLPLDELVAKREAVRALGWECEMDGGDLKITGRT